MIVIKPNWGGDATAVLVTEADKHMNWLSLIHCPSPPGYSRLFPLLLQPTGLAVSISVVSFPTRTRPGRSSQGFAHLHGGRSKYEKSVTLFRVSVGTRLSRGKCLSRGEEHDGGAKTPPDYFAGLFKTNVRGEKMDLFRFGCYVCGRHSQTRKNTVKHLKIKTLSRVCQSCFYRCDEKVSVRSEHIIFTNYLRCLSWSDVWASIKTLSHFSQWLDLLSSH